MTALHPDEAAFLKAIRDRSGDDLPRTIYADWLDEHAGVVICDWCGGSCVDRSPVPFTAPDGRRFEYVGPLGDCPKCKGAGSLPDGRAARAEFIRLQCEWASLPPAERDRHQMPPHAVVTHRAWVETRWRDLLRANWLAWNPPTGIRYEWSRGFVDRVTCPAAAWLAHGDAILARHPIVGVRLTSLPQTSAHTSHGLMPYYTVFTLDGAPRFIRHAVYEEELLAADTAAAQHAVGRRAIAKLLELTWPGVAFELPPAEDVRVQMEVARQLAEIGVPFSRGALYEVAVGTGRAGPVFLPGHFLVRDLT